MPINKHALIRYKTIDQCLQNRFRKWTLEDLMEACSDALYEYEGITKGISRRSIQLDIQTMRSEKLGYNAPIAVTDKKYYSYSDRNYSITNIPLTGHDMETLNNALSLLKQFKGFSYFEELGVMLNKLEDKVAHVSNKGVSAIHFERNDQLKGLHMIDPIHRNIIDKNAIELQYQSYKAQEPSTFVVYPYMLKEYRNRWFLLAATAKMNVATFALDRIHATKALEKVPYKKSPIDIHTFYDEMVGVTRSVNERPVEVVFWVTKEHAPYILTKPIHHTQKILKTEEDGLVISLRVIHNLELERELIGFGAHIKVLGPRRLKSRIKQVLKETIARYEV
ncbi:MAG: WYL domain-containing protein [Flavobacteriales bacterium]|nr:WYL domain-containing protein [Flavobacteriales bacterium]